MAKFITVNCGMEPILVNTDCSVMHFLLYLTNKHMQLQARLYGLILTQSMYEPAAIAKHTSGPLIPSKGK